MDGVTIGHLYMNDIERDVDLIQFSSKYSALLNKLYNY